MCRFVPYTNYKIASKLFFFVKIYVCIFFSNSKFCGDKVAMLSKFGGTVTALPEGMTEFPMFPGMYIFAYISAVCLPILFTLCPLCTFHVFLCFRC